MLKGVDRLDKLVKEALVLHWLGLISQFPKEYIAHKIVEELENAQSIKQENR